VTFSNITALALRAVSQNRERNQVMQRRSVMRYHSITCVTALRVIMPFASRCS
jgi:hypothetical protein